MPLAMPLSAQPDLALIRPGRVHEAVGPARRSFAAALAGRLAGPVLWIAERRQPEMLCPQGLAPFLDPARLILARPTGARALLQTAEEALRSGAVAVVIAELAGAPDLTQSRRLQLAAGDGGGRGLCLVPEGTLRPNAAETRWHCAPLAGAPARQRWELVKNKRGQVGIWEVTSGEVAWAEAAWAEAAWTGTDETDRQGEAALLPPSRSLPLAASA